MILLFTDVGRFFLSIVEFIIMVSFPLLLWNIPFNTFLYFIIHCVPVLAIAAVFYSVYRMIFKLSNEVVLTSNRLNVNK
uniref:Uncharacterized protein n=1 Tax=Piliocolobus tephrosceles TaxID=591936 RepID=A0A8C9IUL0_9PRIM